MSWHAKVSGGYGTGSTEAGENAEQIYFILSARGWGLGAIAGVLGNLQFESQLNPWRWQGDDVLAIGDPQIDYSTLHGYGLFQFTPAGKYCRSSVARQYPGFKPNYSDRTGSDYDGYAQVCFVDEHADYVPTADYPVPYDSYKAFQLNPRYCARVWLANYERGTENLLREAYAEQWYNYLSNVTPLPPDYPPGFIGTVPIGGIVAATRKGGSYSANILKRRLAGRSKASSRWQGKRD